MKMFWIVLSLLLCTNVNAEYIRGVDTTSNLSGVSIETGANVRAGFDFAVNQRLIVTELGWFDYAGDGFDTSHEVGFYAVFPSGGASLLNYVSIPAGTSGRLDTNNPVRDNTGTILGYYRYFPSTVNRIIELSNDNSFDVTLNYSIIGSNPLSGTDIDELLGTSTNNVFINNDLSHIQERMSSQGTGNTLEWPMSAGNGLSQVSIGPNFTYTFPADVDWDEDVDGADFLLLQRSGNIHPAFPSVLQDFKQFHGHNLSGNGLGPVPTPEPTSFFLLTTGWLAAIIYVGRIQRSK